MSTEIFVPRPFPPLDPQKYQWKQLNGSVYWRRSALAGETMWAQRPKEYHQIFLASSLTLSSPILYSKWQSIVKECWLHLRYENPDIGVTAQIAEDGHVYMLAQAPHDDSEAIQWCDATLFLDNQGERLGFNDLKNRLEFLKGERELHQAYILFNTIPDDNETIKQVDLMLNLHHQITDGIGIRILLSKYLSILSTMLMHPTSSTGVDKPTFNWSESLTSLSPPWISVMNEEQCLSGPEYEKVTAWNQEVLLSKMVYIFPFLKPLFCFSLTPYSSLKILASLFPKALQQQIKKPT
jgi:hypothetical protein